ncbi:hypothetical protein ES703_115189 [subsurface metagenome]
MVKFLVANCALKVCAVLNGALAAEFSNVLLLAEGLDVFPEPF